MSSEKKTSTVMRQIDENLRRVYRQDAEKDVPERFQKLLDQLKSSQSGDKPSGTGE